MDSSYSDESAAVDDVFHDDSRVNMEDDILRRSAEEVAHFFHYSRFGHLHWNVSVLTELNWIQSTVVIDFFLQVTLETLWRIFIMFIQ